MAHATNIHFGNTDFNLDSVDRLLQPDFKVILQIGSAVNPAATATASENITEHVAKNIAEIPGAETGSAIATARGPRIHPGMPELIVSRALLRIGQYLIGFLGFLEFFLCFLI